MQSGNYYALFSPVPVRNQRIRDTCECIIDIFCSSSLTETWVLNLDLDVILNFLNLNYYVI